MLFQKKTHPVQRLIAFSRIHYTREPPISGTEGRKIVEWRYPTLARRGAMPTPPDLSRVTIITMIDAYNELFHWVQVFFMLEGKILPRFAGPAR
jgi:hypothetical protein